MIRNYDTDEGPLYQKDPTEMRSAKGSRARGLARAPKKQWFNAPQSLRNLLVYSPLNFGLRFSLKAVIPSRTSAVFEAIS